MPSHPQHAKGETLSQQSRYFRTSPAKGFSPVAASGRVDRTGGDFAAGLVRGASLCTRGEALGHGYWLDSEFIASVTDSALAAGDRGVKARFTHPGLSGDGLGTFLGRFKAHRLDGGKAVADLHFSQAAHHSPDGDLAQYCMDLAESDPEAFAVSIVFEPDITGEREFALEHGAVKTAFGGTETILDFSDFVSPDPANVENMPHARLKQLRAADMVDDPAANPDGLFHREQQFAQEADAVLGYALGLSTAAPACVSFSIHPDRVKGFVAKFLDAHNLKLTTKETDMSADETPAEGAGQEIAQPATATPVEETPASDGQATPEAAEGTETDEKKPAETAPEVQGAGEGEEEKAQAGQEAQGQEGVAPAAAPSGPEATDGLARAECKRFIDAFGAAQGGQWYAEGLSFGQASANHVEALKAENATLRQRLSAAGMGEAEPLAFQAAPAESPEEAARAKRLSGNLGENLGRVAAGIKIRRGNSK